MKITDDDIQHMVYIFLHGSVEFASVSTEQLWVYWVMGQ